MLKVVAIVLGVAILGLGAYFVIQNNQQELSTQQTVSNAESLDGEATFRELLALGDNIRCNVSYEPEEYNGVFDGTVFIAGERMRADFVMNSPEGTMETSVINTGDRVYTWGSTPMGRMAIMFDAPEDTPESDSDDTDEPFDMDENVTYRCGTWTVDASVFAPPADIEFVSFQEQMQQQMQMMQQGQQEVSQQQCDACLNIPDTAAQQQCLQMLGCN